MPANDFDALIDTAQGERPGARLLLVLLRSEAGVHGSGGGTLTPMLANDLAVSPDLSLASVVSQADEVGVAWDMIMAAVLAAPTGEGPSSATAAPHLKTMADDVLRGGDLSRYAVFDRDGNRLAVSRAG